MDLRGGALLREGQVSEFSDLQACLLGNQGKTGPGHTCSKGRKGRNRGEPTALEGVTMQTWEG